MVGWRLHFGIMEPSRRFELEKNDFSNLGNIPVPDRGGAR
jgi:hypothetical protein